MSCANNRSRRKPILAINKVENQPPFDLPEYVCQRLMGAQLSMDAKYRQCVLRRGSIEQTSWISEKFAVIGKMIKFKIGDGWDDGWVVKSVSEAKFPTETEPEEIGLYFSVVESTTHWR